MKKMKYCFILSLYLITIVQLPLLAGSPATTGAGFAAIGANYRLYPSSVTQTEVFITVHPTNPNIMFATANTILFQPFFISEGIYVSTDGGNSWSGSDTCSAPPISFHGGDPGIAVDKNGTFILTRLGINPPFPGLYSHFSTDNGKTWSVQKTITTDDLERASVASDGFPASNYFGRTYAVWVKFAPPYPISIAYTDDGAQNWTAPVPINNPQHRSAGGDLAIGANGKLHVCWAGVTGSSPFTEILTGYASSSDGGNSWSVSEEAFPMNGIQGILTEKQSIRVNGLPRIAVDNSGGAHQGWIYIVTCQKNFAPAGSDPDIILNRSSDGGASWSPGIRVNQDPLNNGKIQYFPAIHVDDGGGVNIIYYDDRNTSSDSCGVFLSRSTDGGSTWIDYQISDHNFKPEPIGGLGQGYQGDNIDLTTVGHMLWPVWMDNSSGIYQIWTAPIDLSLISLDHQSSLPQPTTFVLKQNYPNPFNAATTIEYHLPVSGAVSLEIFDLRGKLIGTIAKDYQTAGIHRVRLNMENFAKGKLLPSGFYFYHLRQGELSQTKSMLYLK